MRIQLPAREILATTPAVVANFELDPGTSDDIQDSQMIFSGQMLHTPDMLTRVLWTQMTSIQREF
jgi:hypothetical protein